ncbi:MAG TPA: hypothetical protein VHT53_03580 [Candidatus Elarobacter sp.]|jgi:hypothetical protein|nr:hypothetical protein [Candidatus Elarobacter sp.]
MVVVPVPSDVTVTDWSPLPSLCSSVNEPDVFPFDAIEKFAKLDGKCALYQLKTVFASSFVV